jgi:acylphosphatase
MQQAVSATVSGNDQEVGFRALVMKQAIEYNLAGFAKNGDPARIDAAITTIRKGTKKSSDIKVTTAPTAVDPALDEFTVDDWTSTSRNITNPYNLVFKLRANDEVLSKSEVHDVWHGILISTLKGEDLKKLGDDD